MAAQLISTKGPWPWASVVDARRPSPCRSVSPRIRPSGGASVDSRPRSGQSAGGAPGSGTRHDLRRVAPFLRAL